MSGESETPFEGVLRQINDTVPFEARVLQRVVP